MLSELREVIRALVSEVVSIPASYLRKELVRMDLQKMISERVKKGEITSEDDLREFFETVDMALKSLKMIPFEVYRASKK